MNNSQVNNLIQQNAKLMDLIDSSNPAQRDAFLFLLDLTIEQVDKNRVFQIDQEQNLDKLLAAVSETIIPLVTQSLSKWKQSLCPPLDSAEAQSYSSLALEFFIRAFHRGDCWDEGGLPSMRDLLLSRGVYDLHLKIVGIVDDIEEANRREREANKINEYQQTREEFAHPNEGRSDISPSEKARLLRRGIGNLNDLGIVSSIYIGTQTWTQLEFDQLKFSGADFKCALQFFEDRRDISVTEVLSVAEQCALKVLEFGPIDEGAWDPIWHIRRATNVGFLLRNWEKVFEKIYS